MKRRILILAIIAAILIGGASTQSFAQTSAGSYWSPAARQLRQEIMNRAILRQARRGGASRYRGTTYRARRRHRR